MKKNFCFIVTICMMFTSCMTDTEKADKLRFQNRFDEAAKLYMKAADAGDGYAMWRLCNAYSNGDGVEYNKEKALEYLKNAADVGCEEAIMELGLSYLNGWHGQVVVKDKGAEIIKDIVKKSNSTYVLTWHAKFLMNEDNEIFDYDLNKGIDILEKIKDRKDAGTCLGVLGLMYLDGNDKIKPDNEKGIALIKKGFERGKSYCALIMGDFYRFGLHGIKQDIDKSIEWYKKGVEANQVNCMIKLSEIYFVEKSDTILGRYCNPNQGIKLLKKAMKHGSGKAYNRMGYIYYNGEYVEKNDEKAFDCYKKATELNSSDGAYNLGHAYINGTGCEKNVNKGIETWTKAADLGNAGAANNLFCYYYSHEFGNPNQDLEKAKKYLLQAANGGDIIGCGNIAYHYYHGSDLFEKNESQAFLYMKKAADQGDIDACKSISYFYANGIGCSKNPNKAREYENKTKAKEDLEKE